MFIILDYSSALEYSIIRRYTNIVYYYYYKQKAAVRHYGEISEWMSIKQGVHQGCEASPHLFAMYTEMIMISLEDKGDFKIDDRVINNLRYADDTVILAETEHEL